MYLVPYDSIVFVRAMSAYFPCALPNSIELAMIFSHTILSSIELKCSLSFWMSYAALYNYKIGVPTHPP